MKLLIKNFIGTMPMFVVMILLMCCNGEEDLGTSDLNTEKPTLNALDTWLRANFTTSHNIDVKYHWDENKTDLNRYLHPPKEDRVRPTMQAVKTVWLDSYSQVGGADFVKKIAPREILLIGGVNKNPSGTITLGLAEGGKRITFFSVDLVDLKDQAELTEFISTIQHEYAHILTQTIPFDIEAYGKITPDNYTAQWFNESESDSRELGYITSYARSNPNEDFAEMVSRMLSNDKTEYDKLINAITSSTAKDKLREKEKFVVDYFKEKFNIDFYELQKAVAANTKKAIK